VGRGGEARRPFTRPAELTDDDVRVLHGRIARRVTDLPRGYRLLGHALRTFPDEDSFIAARRGPDPARDLEAAGLERAYEQVQNDLADIAKAALTLIGRRQPDQPANAVADFRLLADEGFLSREHARTLVDSQRTRSDLQHDYVETPLRAIHQRAVRLRAALPPIARALANLVDSLPAPPDEPGTQPQRGSPSAPRR
jgi:hypothetical protein